MATHLVNSKEDKERTAKLEAKFGIPQKDDLPSAGRSAWAMGVGFRFRGHAMRSIWLRGNCYVSASKDHAEPLVDWLLREALAELALREALAELALRELGCLHDPLLPAPAPKREPKPFPAHRCAHEGCTNPVATKAWADPVVNRMVEDQARALCELYGGLRMKGVSNGNSQDLATAA